MEVLRRKRQLEAENRREGEVLRRQRREINLAKEKSDDLDEVLEAGEVLLDQIERDVVREVELEQEFSHLMEEEEDQVIRILWQLLLAKTRFEIAGKRATQTSCVQLLPPLSGRAQHSTHKVANLSHIFRKKREHFLPRKLDVCCEHAGRHPIPAICPI